MRILINPSIMRSSHASVFTTDKQTSVGQAGMSEKWQERSLRSLSQ